MSSSNPALSYHPLETKHNKNMECLLFSVAAVAYIERQRTHTKSVV